MTKTIPVSSAFCSVDLFVCTEWHTINSNLLLNWFFDSRDKLILSVQEIGFSQDGMEQQLNLPKNTHRYTFSTDIVRKHGESAISPPKSMQSLSIFEVKLLQLLSNVLKEQQKGNFFLEKVTRFEQQFLNMNNSSFMAPQSSPRCWEASSKENMDSNEFQHPIVQQTSFGRDPPTPKNYIEFKIESSKKRLTNNNRELLNDLDKVLTKLGGVKSNAQLSEQRLSENDRSSPRFRFDKEKVDNTKSQSNNNELNSSEDKINRNRNVHFLFQGDTISEQESLERSKEEKILIENRERIEQIESLQLHPNIVIHTVEEGNVFEGQENQMVVERERKNSDMKKPPALKPMTKVSKDDLEGMRKLMKSQECKEEMKNIHKSMVRSSRRQSAVIESTELKGMEESDFDFPKAKIPKANNRLFTQNDNLDLCTLQSFELASSNRLNQQKSLKSSIDKGNTSGFDFNNMNIQKSHIYQIGSPFGTSQRMDSVIEKDGDNQSSGRIGDDLLHQPSNNRIRTVASFDRRKRKLNRVASIESRDFRDNDSSSNARSHFLDINKRIIQVESENKILSSSNDADELNFAEFNGGIPYILKKSSVVMQNRKRRMSLANNLELQEEVKKLNFLALEDEQNTLNLPICKPSKKQIGQSPKDRAKEYMAASSNTRSNNGNKSIHLLLPEQFMHNQNFNIQDIIREQYKLSEYSRGSNFSKIKEYARLNSVQPYVDKREIKIKISFYEMVQSAHIFKFSHRKQLQVYIYEWLGIVYRTIASISWHMLYNKLLDFDETKILFTDNIIYNFIQLMEDARKLGLVESMEIIPEIINKKSIPILNFLCKHYPQTKVLSANLTLRSLIPQINQKGRIQYELVRRSKVQFRLKKTHDYATEIMLFINYLIDVSNAEYDEFESFMNELFNKLYLPKSERGCLHSSNESADFERKQRNLAYQEKVKKYTKFAIGRKIPKNSMKYTQEQIQNGIFFVKSSATHRVLSKWAEDLIEVIKDPDSMIKDWFHPFKNHDGSEQYAQYPIRKGIHEQIIKNRDDLFAKMQNIRKQCYRIQGELSEPTHISYHDQQHLSQEQLNVGLFASNIRNAISSYLCQQLSEVIHFLLKAPIKVDEHRIGVAQYFEEKTRTELDSINLITFRIFDLLRCKCTSGQAEIVWLMNELRELEKKSEGSRLVIVRFKDRLNQGSRDILINAQLGNSPVFEIQLAVTNQVEEKQQFLDKYNHFLYELRRSTMLGPLVENVSIWTSLQQKSSYFDDIVKQKFRKESPIPYDHQCKGNLPLKKFMHPMVCISCESFLHIPRSCFLNWVCIQCRSTICGECLYLGTSPQVRKRQLFGKVFSRQFLAMLKQYHPPATINMKAQHSEAILPKNLFFLKKDVLRAELNYMTTYQVHEANVSNEQEDVLKAVQTVLSADGTRVINKSLIYSNAEFHGKFKNLVLYQFNPHGRRHFLTTEEISSLDEDNDGKLRFIDLLHQPNYLEKIREFSNGKKKQRFLSNLELLLGAGRKIQVVKIKRILILIQPCLDYQELETEIMCRQNLLRLRAFAQSHSSVISIQKRNMTLEMGLLEFDLGKQLYYGLCKNVSKLYLNYGQIENIEPLIKMNNVQSLYISHNKLKSLKGIERMSKLTILNFDQNKVEGLEELYKLYKLEYIMGNENQIKSLKGIENLTKVKEISLHGNQIQKMQAFDRLTELEVLFLRSNKLEKIQNFECLKGLENLTLSVNSITIIENLTGIKALKSISLCQLNLREIPDEVSKLILLHELNLSDNKIQKIEKLSALINLKVVKLKNNRLRKIQGLDGLKLVHLNVDGNKITAITGIASLLDTIEELSIRKNPIEDCGDLIGTQIDFKICWTKNTFKPKARFDLESIFRNQQTSSVNLNASILKSSYFKSSKNLSESLEFALKEK